MTTTGARRATSIIFLICGTAISSWAPLVPFAKANLAVDDAALGLILLALGGGSMVAMPLAGVAIHYWGSRPVIVTTVALACLALPLLAVHVTPAMLAGTLFVFGAALGAMDVAMNAQAIAVQHAAARPIMSGFHAFFSVGGLLGATIMTLMLRAGLSPIASAAGLAVALLALGLSQHASFLPDRGASAVSTTFRIAPSPRVLLLGALCFIAFLAEGAVLDWSAVFLRELRQVDISIAGVGYAVFSVTMIAGRLTGDRLTHRLGAARILRLGGLLCSAGFLCVAWRSTHGGRARRLRGNRPRRIQHRPRAVQRDRTSSWRTTRHRAGDGHHDRLRGAARRPGVDWIRRRSHEPAGRVRRGRRDARVDHGQCARHP